MVIFSEYKSTSSVLCPLVDEHIDGFDCMEFQCIIENNIPDKFKQKDNWQDLCENCENRGLA